MGWNSTVLILNDRLSEVAKPEFGATLADAIGRIRNSQIVLPGSQATVIETHHADDTAVVAVGGNCATVLATILVSKHHTPEGQLNVLRRLAEQLGYDLVLRHRGPEAGRTRR